MQPACPPTGQSGRSPQWDRLQPEVNLVKVNRFGLAPAPGGGPALGRFGPSRVPFGSFFIDKMIVLQSKVGLSPDLESTRLWERDFKRQLEAALGQHLHCRNIGIWIAGAWGFMLASHMCRFEDDLLPSSSLRLAHILLAVCRSIKL